MELWGLWSQCNYLMMGECVCWNDFLLPVMSAQSRRTVQVQQPPCVCVCQRFINMDPYTYSMSLLSH